MPRIGLGYDIHQFSKGRPLILGGVQVPSEEGLLGHSDADVVLHAVCDALLGAAGLGDIGSHFPDTDERYRGISSILLLTHVSRLVRRKGYTVGNVDVMLMLESPKVASHVPEMIRRTAEAIGIPSTGVSIKATTNERLGALGRREGCAALAVALVAPPNA